MGRFRRHLFAAAAGMLLAAPAMADEIDDIVVYLDGVEMLVGHLPSYPESALREGLSGEVVVVFLVVEGGIEELRLVRSTDERFTESIRKVVYSWLIQSDFDAWRASGLCSVERRGAHVVFDAGTGSVQLAPVEVEAPPGSELAQTLSGDDIARLVWPSLDRHVEPDYPGRAYKKGESGSAAVAYTVDPDGRLADIHVIESAPDESFGNQTRRALRQWVYAPATLDGEAVPVRMCLRQDFSFHERRIDAFWDEFTRPAPEGLMDPGG